ncbi:MAG: ROK family protein [Tissierellaceae bacterium]|jgi:glucokinase|nr:ROK family protein [Tissierellia bacterium]
MKKAIGIDLGGTSILGGLIDEDGMIIKRAETESRTAKGRKEVLKRISEIINALMEDGVIGITIGSPGFIDTKEGRVLKVGGNIKDWAGTPIKEELQKEFNDLPIFVENDANIAALCEHWKGAARDYDSFLMLTLGSGVGGAIYIENHGLLYGHSYQGAELGHLILYPNGRQCTCGQKGCVEQYVSGKAIEKMYEELTSISKSGKEIFNNIHVDEIAKGLIREFSRNLGIYLTSLKNAFDPEGIVIGGGVINSRNIWWDDMIDSYKEHVNDSEGMDIVPAHYLNDAGMIGAGKLVFDRLV